MVSASTCFSSMALFSFSEASKLPVYAAPALLKMEIPSSGTVLRSLTEMGATILDDVPVSPDGHIITLSTCIADMPLNRLLIVAARRETEPAATSA